jgi:hypothetical protein
MRTIETFSRARRAQISDRKELSSWTFYIAAALAIVLIACALGRVTFQSGSGAWKPLGPSEDSLVGQ